MVASCKIMVSRVYLGVSSCTFRRKKGKNCGEPASYKPLSRKGFWLSVCFLDVIFCFVSYIYIVLYAISVCHIPLYILLFYYIMFYIYKYTSIIHIIYRNTL